MTGPLEARRIGRSRSGLGQGAATASHRVDSRIDLGFLLALLALTAAPATVEAQSLPLMAQVQLGRERVFVGERFSVRVRVVGSVLPNEPDVSAIRDFDVEYFRRDGSSSQRETIFHYFLRARRAGTLEIPPIFVSGGGAKAKTALARVEARLPENPGKFRFRVEPERETGYVGQQILVNFTFECDANAKNIQVDAPFLQDERLVALMNTNPFRGRLPDGYERVPVNRAMMVAQREPAAEKGRKVLKFAAVVIPQRVGRILLQFASAIATIPVSSGAAAVPETAVGRGGKQVVLNSPTAEIRDDSEQRGFVHSEAIALRVREVPRQRVPADFNGLIGRYDASANVEPPRITFGDPLKLVVSLSGQPYLAEATLPDLRNHTGLLANFEVRRADEFSSLEGSRKVFRYDLRPTRSGNLVIPAIAYSYFDPDSGAYVSTNSDPLHVQVDENRVLTASDAEGPALANIDPVGPADDAMIPDGLAENGAGDGAAATAVATDFVTVATLWSRAVVTLQSPWIVGSLVAAPLIFVAVWLARAVAKLKSRRDASPAAPSPYGQLESELAARFPHGVDSQASSAAFAVFREYLGRRFELPASSMTFRDLAPRVEAHGLSPRVIQRLEELFAKADAARYGAAPAGANNFAPAKLRDLARQIESELRTVSDPRGRAAP